MIPKMANSFGVPGTPRCSELLLLFSFVISAVINGMSGLPKTVKRGGKV